jgi:hypothetical protein
MDNQLLIIFGVHLACAFAMLIIGSLVQVLIYPQFLHVGPGERMSYARHHARRISYIVGPILLIEALSWTAVLCSPLPVGLLSIVSTITLLGIWGLTFAIIVPLHHHIQQHGQDSDIKRLIYYNGIRTFLWALRFWVLIMLLRDTFIPMLNTMIPAV